MAQSSTVLYVAGYGRSGSTVLDSLLGNHPAIFGGGELTGFFRHLAREAPCACGASLRNCEFWRGVVGLAGVAPDDWREVHRLTWRIDSGKSAGPNERYGSVWRAVFGALTEVSGRPFVVDSSKTTWMSQARAVRLADSAGLDVKVIHLLRDPRAVVWSASRGSNKALEAGERLVPYGATVRTVASWIRANQVAAGMGERLSPDRLLTVSYEQLVTAPAEELRRIASFVGVPEDPLLDLLRDGRGVEPGHGVSGNRLRRSGTFRLKPDTEWKERLPASMSLVASVALPFYRSLIRRSQGC